MGTVNFYDKDQNLVMQFGKFYFSKDNIITKTGFTGKVDIDFFHLETDFEVEISDFESLLSSLQQMYKGNQKYVTFNPLSPKIYFQFLAENYGHIRVECEIINDINTCRLKFEYRIEQSFLPELILEIESILDINKE